MLRVFVSHVEPGSRPPACAADTQCSTDGQGRYVSVWHAKGNCIEATDVTVRRPDGTVVEILLSTCLAWDGTENKPAVEALTVDQATALAGNPVLGNQMDAAFVQKANDRYRGVSRLT